jgi:hypothetical protein
MKHNRNIERALSIEGSKVRMVRHDPYWAVDVFYDETQKWRLSHIHDYRTARKLRAWILAERVLKATAPHSQSVWNRWGNYRLDWEWSARKILAYALHGETQSIQLELIERKSTP